jgi:hypothetical protein
MSVLLIDLGGTTKEDVKLPEPARWTFGGGAKKYAQVEELSILTSTGGTKRASGWFPNGFGLLQTHKLTDPDKGHWVKMHMISAAIGGRAEDRNSIPAPHSINTGAQVVSFEDALKRLVASTDEETKKPNVVWIRTQVTDFHPSGTTYTSAGAPLSYGATDFVQSITMRSGLHFYTENGWQKDTKERISEDVTIRLPDFTLSASVSINYDGEPRIMKACGCSYIFAQHIIAERLINKNFSNPLEVESRMKDYWDNVLKARRGKPFDNNLKKVIDALPPKGNNLSF